VWEAVGFTQWFFGEGGLVFQLRSLVIGKQRSQIVALDGFGNFEAADCEEGGHEVDCFDGFSDSFSLWKTFKLPENEGDIHEFAVGALAVESASVLEEFFAVVAYECDEGGFFETEFVEFGDQLSDLVVHSANRAVVVSFYVVEIGFGVYVCFFEILPDGHRKDLQGGVSDDFAQCCDAGILFTLGFRVDPHCIVGTVGFEGVVGIEEVKEDEEGHVFVDFEPGHEAGNKYLRGFSVENALEGAGFVNGLEALMEVGLLSCEGD